MEDEVEYLRRSIERYTSLLQGVNDDNLCRELERLLQEAKHRLQEIERRR